jgi:tRNA 5-methylaminomethyl-2-thiouridine biosynthesis bifunctional protein
MKFDVCMFDPFSPKKCPKLWDEKIFKEVYGLLNEKAILTTYSCARIARNNMKKIGFDVKNGPSIGRKAPSTIAIKNERQDTL